jgi:lysophospholipid acyltransferase (LPLAT)-like uncharacterized protein
VESIGLKAFGALSVYIALTRSCRAGPEVGVEVLADLVRSPRPAILSFWHSRILGCVRTIEIHLQQRGHPLHVLISRSRDGELIARALTLRGVSAARGSASRGGSRALRELVHYLEQTRGLVVTTPDGPRGPSRRLKPGTVLLAQLSGAPILPMSFAASRSWRLSSWDRFIVPKPFSRLAAVVGEPIHVPRDLDRDGREAACRRVEAAIREADERAAASVGVPV